MHDIYEMMEILDCMEEGKFIYNHFKRPNWDLDFGMYALASDHNIKHFRPYISEHNLIEVYKEFWKTNLHTYNMSPNPTNLKIHEIHESLCTKSLNSKIIKGRDKPIITCLEFIRKYIMSKIVIVQKAIDKAIGAVLCRIESTRLQLKACISVWLMWGIKLVHVTCGKQQACAASTSLQQYGICDSIMNIFGYLRHGFTLHIG
uniref:Uncharacterized protein n=1 Tax=Lactuca sativa TaxID=4236 RepID=A0A9R1W9E9_LACSA|nr:hypothetical protein LSAT_V11C200087960 [Lactuca sativa]